MYDFKTPQDYFAPCDGVNDDKPAFDAVLAAGDNLYLPTGSYALSAPVIVPPGRSIVGSDNRPSIKALSDNFALFEVGGSDVSIRNVKGLFNHLPLGGGLVKLRNDLGVMERIELERLIAFGANSLVNDVAASSNIIVSLTVKEVVGRIHRGPGFDFQRVFAYLRMIDNLVDCVGAIGSAAHNKKGYSLQNNQGAFWERCDITGGMVDATVTTGHGFYFKNCVANWLNSCMADTVGGGGLFLDGGNEHFYVDKFISSLVGTHPFSIVGNNRITLSGCEAGGRQGLPYAPNYPGFVLLNSPRMIVDDACRGYNNVGGLSTVTNCPNSRINPFNG